MSKKKSDFPLVGIALDTPVKPKKYRAGKLKAIKAKIKRVVSGSTEVMVKITGGASGGKHLKAHMDYIGRNGKIELENERGEILETRERVREEHKDWCNDLGKPRKNHSVVDEQGNVIKKGRDARDTINVVLSMPADTDPEAVRKAARAFAKEQFGENNQYLMALHHAGNDKGTKNPHVHLTVKARGYDGSRLDPKLADLQEWRESFAEKMREQGYDAEATPRRARGVIEKGQRSVVRAIQDDQKRPGRGEVQPAKIKEAADDLRGKTVSKNPYREQIIETQNEVRKGWLKGADELDKSTDPEDKELAVLVRKFVDKLPKNLQDERGRIKAELVKQVEANRKKEAGHQTPQPETKKDTPDKDLER